MHPEIQAVISLVRENKIWDAVAPFLDRMADLESDFPDVLRQNTLSPTGMIKELNASCGDPNAVVQACKFDKFAH